MQYEPLKELQRIRKALTHIDANNAKDSIVNYEKVEKELHSTLDGLRPVLGEIGEAFNAIDQAKSIKQLVRGIDKAMDGVHVLEDGQMLTPGQAGEALSGLGQLADYADSIIDPDFLKTSIN